MKKYIVVFVVLFTLTSYGQSALSFSSNVSPTQTVSIPSISCPNEFTFEMWVNYSGQADNFATLLEFGNDAPYFGLEGQKPTLYNAISATSDLMLGVWTHIAVSYSSITQIAKIYVNGVLDNTTTGININLSGIGAGIAFNSGEVVFNGSIDDVRIWNLVRTDSEINLFKSSCLSGSEIGLYAYYNFDEGFGTIINDLTVNNFDGTLISSNPSSNWITGVICETLSESENGIVQNNIIVYPNPSVGNYSFQINDLSNIDVYDTSGRIIYKEKDKVGSIYFNLNEQASGLYFLKISNETKSEVVKLIKN